MKIKNNGSSLKNVKKSAVAIFKIGVTALFWIGLWQILSIMVNKEILLPSPAVTFEHLLSLFTTLEFFKACGVSLLRIMLGFLSGALIGVILAVICHLVPFINTLLTPMKATVKTTPVASFIIIAYMWLAKSEIPGFIASLIVIPIVWTNIMTGLENTDVKLIEVGRIFSFSKWYFVKYIYFPAVKPYLISAALTGIGLAWKSGIAAEVLVVANDGIGGMLHQSKVNYDMADMFAITLVVIAISLVIEMTFERAVKKTERKKSDRND
jgi:NitT/TauT family transport system permease protein